MILWGRIALHIHERINTQAILKVAAREDVNRSLFAGREREYNEGYVRRPGTGSRSGGPFVRDRGAKRTVVVER